MIALGLRLLVSPNKTLNELSLSTDARVCAHSTQSEQHCHKLGGKCFKEYHFHPNLIAGLLILRQKQSIALDQNALLQRHYISKDGYKSFE